jgi:hypothetical protein
MTEVKYKLCHLEKVNCVIAVKEYEKYGAGDKERAAQID